MAISTGFTRIENPRRSPILVGPPPPRPPTGHRRTRSPRPRFASRSPSHPPSPSLRAHAMATHSRCTGFWTTLAVTVAVATAATVAVVDPSSDDVVVYDQRQNGTENVRISLSDLKVVLAPADGLLQIMSMAGAQLLNTELLGHDASEHRPIAGAECTGFKCNNRHRQAAKKNRFKLSSLIAPLLSQAEQKTVVQTTDSDSNNNENNNSTDH